MTEQFANQQLKVRTIDPPAGVVSQDTRYSQKKKYTKKPRGHRSQLKVHFLY